MIPICLTKEEVENLKKRGLKEDIDFKIVDEGTRPCDGTYVYEIQFKKDTTLA